MELFFLFIIFGVILLGVGWFSRKRNHRAIVVTGTVVAMRREVEYRYLDKRRGMPRATRFGDEIVSGTFTRAVTVYKPIVRFAYLDGVQEAVVQDASEYKPDLNVSMEIAFLPENPAKAWRPAKEAIWGDLLIFVGLCMLVAGVLGCLGFLPFLAGDDAARAAVGADW